MEYLIIVELFINQEHRLEELRKVCKGYRGEWIQTVERLTGKDVYFRFKSSDDAGRFLTRLFELKVNSGRFFAR